MKTRRVVAREVAEHGSGRTIAAAHGSPARPPKSKHEHFLGTTAGRGPFLATLLVAALVAPAAGAEPPKADQAATIGGGAMARVLPPAEKIKVLEDELAKETDRRVKAEEELARRSAEHNELLAASKIAAKERASLEARLADAGAREGQVQKANERLRLENERIAVTIRVTLPIVAVLILAVLGLLVWNFLFLRKLATRVHGTKTLAEMQELEAKLVHAHGQLDAEMRRNHTLRGKLAELGIVDEEVTPRPTGSWRTR
jgi:hypothetical protein